MSITAVRSWIEAQDAAGRLHLVSAPDREHERRAVADAFHSISAGLPLHLIYSFEMVARSGEPIRADDVAALPPCPTGDIRDYYRRFLDRASPRAKEILHLLAGIVSAVMAMPMLSRKFRICSSFAKPTSSLFTVASSLS